MKHILFSLTAICCFLFACNSNAERDEKIKAAITADLQRITAYANDADTSLHDLHRTIDSVFVVKVTPIAASKYIALRTESLKKYISGMEDILANNRRSLQNDQESRKQSEAYAREGGGSTAYFQKDADKYKAIIDRDLHYVTRDSLALEGYKEDLNNLQQVKVTGEKPGAYYVQVRYTDHDMHEQSDGECMYLVTEDMKATQCHK